jgi:hypothetical protein
MVATNREILRRSKDDTMTALSHDNVFRDGSSLQVANVSGDADVGYLAELTVAV